MLETPRIVQSSPQQIAFLHLTVPRNQIQHVMGPGLREVKEVVEAQGVKIADPWFTHHLRMPADTIDFEICVPVSKPINPTVRVRAGEWPAMTVARTVYHGPFEGLAAAWSEFQTWIDAQGMKAREDLWERYLVGPESGPDPSHWRTELNRPLVEPLQSGVVAKSE